MSVDVAQIGGDLEVYVVAEPVESGRRVYKYYTALRQLILSTYFGSR